MRTYYRARGGVDGAVQTLLFWAVIITAPVWVPVGAVLLVIALLWPRKPAPAPMPEPAICAAWHNLDAQGVSNAKAKLIEHGCKP